MKTKPTVIAIDLETTGLNPITCKILEVSMYELDENFNIISSFEGILPYRNYVDNIDPFVVNMHIDNGLLNFVDDMPIVSTDSHSNCTTQDIFNWLNKFEKIIFLGNSVAFDISFIRSCIPEIVGKIHYRSFDVRTLLMLYDLDKVIPKQPTIHRAKDDIMWSIEVVQKYKEIVGIGLDNYNYINNIMY
jgi:oligoribonuclease (3'-5' exoribonuclease)